MVFIGIYQVLFSKCYEKELLGDNIWAIMHNLQLSCSLIANFI